MIDVNEIKPSDPWSIRTKSGVIRHGIFDLREQKFETDGIPIPFDTPRYWCPLCFKKILTIPIIWILTDKSKPVVISGEWAFHMRDTHGIPVELLPEVIFNALSAVNSVSEVPEMGDDAHSEVLDDWRARG
jgi:hypothetical protein